MYAGLTRARVVQPAEVAQRRARWRWVLWSLLFAAGLVAAVLGGHALWDWYSSPGDTLPGAPIPTG